MTLQAQRHVRRQVRSMTRQASRHVRCHANVWAATAVSGLGAPRRLSGALQHTVEGGGGSAGRQRGGGKESRGKGTEG